MADPRSATRRTVSAMPYWRLSLRRLNNSPFASHTGIG